MKLLGRGNREKKMVKELKMKPLHSKDKKGMQWSRGSRNGHGGQEGHHYQY